MRVIDQTFSQSWAKLSHARTRDEAAKQRISVFRYGEKTYFKIRDIAAQEIVVIEGCGDCFESLLKNHVLHNPCRQIY